MTATPIRPPFTRETALAKVQAAEDAWHRSSGSEMWEFDDEGLMARRYASINDATIREDERRMPAPGQSAETPGASR